MTIKEKNYYFRPNKGKIFLRSFVPWQIYRFIVINIKMMKMMLNHTESIFKS
jgi:hypothetical protein